MLEKIIESSSKYPFLVLTDLFAIVFLGWRAAVAVPIDAFPDVTPIQVNVYTESPGLAAEDVEQLLTFPIESGMAGLPSVQQIRSVSLFGLSYVAVYFEDDMDIYFARRLVMERLQEVAARIPEGYGTHEMTSSTPGAVLRMSRTVQSCNARSSRFLGSCFWSCSSAYSRVYQKTWPKPDVFGPISGVP